MLEKYIPCLLDPRNECPESCQLRSVAEANKMYLQKERQPHTQAAIVAQFAERSDEENVGILTEKMDIFVMNQQIHKCNTIENLLKRNAQTEL